MKKAFIKSIVLNTVAILILIVVAFMLHNLIGYQAGCIGGIIAFIGTMKHIAKISSNVDEYSKYFNIR